MYLPHVCLAARLIALVRPEIGVQAALGVREGLSLRVHPGDGETAAFFSTGHRGIEL